MEISTDVDWSRLVNLQHLCSSEKSILYTGIFDKKTVVVKTINPLCQDDIFVEDLETELSILSKVKHNNIIQLYGAGHTPNGNRFLILEYLEGGTLSQKVQLKTVNKYPMCKRKQFKFKMENVMIYARSIADALAYCQTSAIDDCMLLHRDLKPDNIGFTSNGEIKIMDFGLATVIDNSSPISNKVYVMSGETGSLRYMAPEVAQCKPYNHKVDVYSFGILLWELLTFKRPYYNLESNFYKQVIINGARPNIDSSWPKDLIDLMEACWNPNIMMRPTFQNIVNMLDYILFNIPCSEDSCMSLSSSFHGKGAHPMLTTNAAWHII